MKRAIIIAIAVAAFSSCAKEKRQYELTFSASHCIEQSNIYVDGLDPYANYYWRVEDEDCNCVFERYGNVLLDTISETLSAESGYTILIRVSVNDVLDIGSVSCISSDGSVSTTLETQMTNNENAAATMREIEFELM